MKKTLRFVALAAVLVLPFWVGNGEAADITSGAQVCGVLLAVDGELQTAQPGGLEPIFLSENQLNSCRDLLNECSAACDPSDPFCGQDCQCQFLICKGYQCN